MSTLPAIPEVKERYKLDPKKFHDISISEFGTVISRLCSTIKVDEDFEYFDSVKKYLNIPQPHKSMEELLKEYETICEWRERETRRKFASLGERTDHKFENSGRRIQSKLTVGLGLQTDDCVLISNSLGSLDWAPFETASMSVTALRSEHTKEVVGYYSVPGGARIESTKTPPFIGRWALQVSLGWQWISTRKPSKERCHAQASTYTQLYS
jgi:hypothetical protein